MSNASDTIKKQRIEISYSKQLAIILWGQHSLAFAVLCYCQLPFALLCGFGGIIAVSLARTLKRYAYRCYDDTICQLIECEDSHWQVIHSNGNSTQAELHERNYCGYYFIIVNFKMTVNAQQIVVFIMRDAVEENQWRRLSAYLQLLK